MGPVLILALAATAAAELLPVTLTTRRALDSGLANVHVRYGAPISHEITFAYGGCDAAGPEDAHHLVGRTIGSEHTRLVWRIPEDATSGGCLSAWAPDKTLLGHSNALKIAPSARTRSRRLAKRQSEEGIEMSNKTGIDTDGPWFDGVLALPEGNGPVDEEAAKANNIAIVGAGAAGLMTWLALDSVGMKNLSIIEARDRLGGRINTEYFGPATDRQYQEMGPMRIPWEIKYTADSDALPIVDQRIIFQVADELNKRSNHGNTSSDRVSFIDFIQNNPNSLYYVEGVKLPNGLVPTVSDVAADPTLLGPQPPPNPQVQAASAALLSILTNTTTTSSVARDSYRAHKAFLQSGVSGLPGDSWSEFAYLHLHLGFPAEVVYEALGSATGGAFPADPGRGLWDNIHTFTTLVFATSFKTIDGGMSRLPRAFMPLIQNITRLNTKVQRVTYNQTTKKVTLHHTPSDKPAAANLERSTFDLAILTPPPTVLSTWRMPPLPARLTTAISAYPFGSTCKVALRFNTRFWENLPRPILGGCNSVSRIPGIASLCYPSYDLNSTRGGVLLATYTLPVDQTRWFSLSDAEHAQYVLDATAEMHGNVVYEQYTGEYKRVCWSTDQFANGAWAEPRVGTREAFMPEWFKTHSGLVFTGDATHFTAQWISSSMESGIRAAVQVLLGLGLVDEAKEVVEKWMARYIHV